MTENALLVVTRPQLMLERVGGLTVIERQLITAARAGLKRLWIGASPPDRKILSALRLPDGLEISWSQRGASYECPAPYLQLSGDHFIRAETLRYVAQAAYRVHVTLEDAAGASVIQVVPFRAESPPASARQPLPIGATVFLDTPVGRGPELTWLLAAGTKSQDGFMARYFDRYISLAVSRLLLDTPVTPNMMTVLSSLLGLFGAGCFLSPRNGNRLLGATLIWLHSVLDGCDGELARLRFQESAFGGFIDFWGDNIVHLALFGCMAWGFYKADQNALPLLLGLACAIGTVGSAFLMYREKDARRTQASEIAPEGIQPALVKLGDLLAGRDFIYLLLILAYVHFRTDHGLYEFLWATAVGSLLFFVMMLYLRGAKNEQTSQSSTPRQGEAGSPAAGDGSGHQHLYSRS